MLKELEEKHKNKIDYDKEVKKKLHKRIQDLEHNMSLLESPLNLRRQIGKETDDPSVPLIQRSSNFNKEREDQNEKETSISYDKNGYVAGPKFNETESSEEMNAQNNQRKDSTSEKEEEKEQKARDETNENELMDEGKESEKEMELDDLLERESESKKEKIKRELDADIERDSRNIQNERIKELQEQLLQTEQQIAAMQDKLKIRERDSEQRKLQEEDFLEEMRNRRERIQQGKEQQEALKEQIIKNEEAAKKRRKKQLKEKKLQSKLKPYGMLKPIQEKIKTKTRKRNLSKEKLGKRKKSKNISTDSIEGRKNSERGKRDGETSLHIKHPCARCSNKELSSTLKAQSQQNLPTFKNNIF
jgi:hypothetical protein